MDTQIQDLQNKILEQQSTIKMLSENVTSIQLSLGELLSRFDKHAHAGDDGTKVISSRVKMKSGDELEIGDTAFGGVTGSTNDPTTQRGYIIVGNDKEVSDGSENSQFIIEHQPSTTGSTNQTFIYANRAPLFTGTNGSVTSGGTTVETNTKSFKPNQLDGGYVIVKNSATEFDCYEIASNTNSKITVTGGTWSFSNSSAEWIVFMPVYLGSSEYPFRRLYITESTSGGIRFGFGDTAGGLNGLLYMDSTGDLYWRNKSGTSTKLN